jgi:hypothetical protein
MYEVNIVPELLQLYNVILKNKLKIIRMSENYSVIDNTHMYVIHLLYPNPNNIAFIHLYNKR